MGVGIIKNSEVSTILADQNFCDWSIGSNISQDGLLKISNDPILVIVKFYEIFSLAVSGHGAPRLASAVSGASPGAPWPETVKWPISSNTTLLTPTCWQDAASQTSEQSTVVPERNGAVGEAEIFLGLQNLD